MSARPFGHRAFIGGGRRRVEAKAAVAPGHRSYSGTGPFRTTSDPQVAERHERELLRRALWLHCERAPFDRAHP